MIGAAPRQAAVAGIQERIARNLASIRERIAAAAARAGRRPDEVKLVAVAKYVGPSETKALAAAGCPDVGESRPQELWHKAEALRGEPIRWHLVGHLQRNKVERTLPLVEWIHSVDSVRLLAALEAAAAKMNLRPNVLLEVNIPADPARHGFAADELAPLVPQLASYPHLHVRGLMAMAGQAENPTAARADFARLRGLRDRLLSAVPPGVVLDELSMGMSGDFEAAIEEGSTIVRIGTALFEGIADH
jgi:pyridoxal phosphate enzyme (YggS family)